jgi:predicted NodU family carbamoyl transferase
VTILGIGDGPSSGAALVVDGSIACVAPQPPGSEGLPAAAIAAVLEDAGAVASDVDVVALAGRFTTPLLVRRFPGLEELSGTIALRRAAAVWQTALRTTGLGALQADRAAAWLATRLQPLGFTPRNHRAVDLHTCLASAAYRCQDRDDAVIVTVEPHGDGLLAAVHQGMSGHLERVWDQRAEPALHTHLDRCARVLHLPVPSDLAAFDALAGDAVPDRALVALVSPHVDSGRLAGGLSAESASRLAACDPTIGAASVAEGMRRAMVALVSAHVPPRANLALGGAWLADPNTVSALAELDAARIACGPDLGGATAALGAALHEIGSAPASVPATLGPRHTEASLRDLVRETGGEEVRDERAMASLSAGKVWGRIAGRSGNGSLGTRSVLVRTGDDAALARARAVSGPAMPAHLRAAAPPGLERLGPALAHGMADSGGRTRVVSAEHDPDLATLVAAVPGGLEALPLADDPRRALALLREGRLDGLLLGPFQVLAA